MAIHSPVKPARDLVMVAFLDLNGVELTASNAEVLTAMLALAAGALTEVELAHWIDAHSTRP